MTVPLLFEYWPIIVPGIVAPAAVPGHLLALAATVGLLFAFLAVVVSKPNEEEDEARTEPRSPATKAVVSVSRDREPRTVAHLANQEAAIRVAEPSPSRRPRALIVGSGSVAQTLSHNLERAGGYEVVGFVDDPSSANGAPPTPLLGSRAATSEIVRKYGVEAVFIASTPSWQQSLAETVTAENPDVSVNVVPSFHEALLRLNRVRSCGDIALVSVTPPAERFNDLTKRIFDVAAATFGLIVTAPLLVIVGVLIKISSPGPIVFYQKRVGRDGNIFMLYKLRTMVIDAEAKTGPVLADGKADARLTRIGRILRMFRIDELPQFWNVIRGDMSMVGPRPERPFFVEQFQQRLPSYSKRHQVRPGITGLAQVHGGYHTKAEDKLRFDLIYVSQHSLWLDLSILLRTVLVVCKPNR